MVFNTVFLFIPWLNLLSSFPSKFILFLPHHQILVQPHSSLPLLSHVLVKHHCSTISSLSPLTVPTPSLLDGLSISNHPSAMPFLTFQSPFPDKSTCLLQPQPFLMNSALPSQPFLPSNYTHHFHFTCSLFSLLPPSAWLFQCRSSWCRNSPTSSLQHQIPLHGVTLWDGCMYSLTSTGKYLTAEI